MAKSNIKAIGQKERLHVFQVLDKNYQNKLTNIHKAKHPLSN